MPATATTEIETSENQLSETKPELRSIRDIVKDLSKPVAQKHLRKRRQGGKEITYLSWHDAVKYLDHFAPGWCYEIRHRGFNRRKIDYDRPADDSVS